jgi:hypothetical protein
VRKFSDEMVREISVLAQRLKGIIPHIEDYGLSGQNGIVVSELHFLLDEFDLTAEAKALVELQLRHELQRGIAEKMSMGTDILTQLGATIGPLGTSIEL